MASGLAAIPPNSHADLTRARAEGRVATSLPRDTKQTGTKQRDFQKRKTKRGDGAPLTVWVWSSVMVHTRGENRNMQTRT